MVCVSAGSWLLESLTMLQYSKTANYPTEENVDFKTRLDYNPTCYT